MRGILIWTAFCLFATYPAAGSVSALAKAQRLEVADSCIGLSDSICRRYIKLMSTAGQDSIPQLLGYWESSCGIYEPQIRARLLYAIALNAYEPKMWDTLMYEESVWYEWRLNQSRMTVGSEMEFLSYPQRYGFVPLNSPFDSFTLSFANHYLRYTDLKPSEKVLLHLFSGSIPAFYQILQQDKSPGNFFAGLYQEELQYVLKMPEPFVRFGVGLWSAQGAAEILGIHPFLNLDGGVYKKRWGWEADFELRMLQSRDSFSFENRRVSVQTDRFSGWGLNVCGTVNISERSQNRLNLKLGVGWDALAISVLQEDEPEPYDQLFFASSPAAIFGFEWSGKIKSGFWTIAYNRHLMDYSIAGTTNLNGFAHSMRICRGFYLNPEKSERLRAFHYPLEEEGM